MEKFMLARAKEFCQARDGDENYVFSEEDILHLMQFVALSSIHDSKVRDWAIKEEGE